VFPEHPHKDEHLRVSDAVLALRDPDHGELHGARASFHEFSHHLVQTLQVIGDDLRYWTVRSLLVTLIQAVTPLLSRDLAIYLALKLYQHGRQHA
jgi:hypothetical protein